jgi:NUMOD3 motif
MLGKHHSKDSKRKISESVKANQPMKGKHWPQEVRDKIRASNIGQKRSKQTKKNISRPRFKLAPDCLSDRHEFCTFSFAGGTGCQCNCHPKNR